MKKACALSVVVLFTVVGFAYAQSAAPDQPAVTGQDTLAAKKASLNNTDWTIELKPMAGGKKARAEKDTIHFADGKVSSTNLTKAGYGPTNFTLRMLEDNETLTWETMQTSEKSGVAFWRGDIGPDNVMRGVLSKRDLKDRTTDFNFVSTGSQKVAPPTPPAPVATGE